MSTPSMILRVWIRTRQSTWVLQIDPSIRNSFVLILNPEPHSLVKPGHPQSKFADHQECAFSYHVSILASVWYHYPKMCIIPDAQQKR